MLHGTYCTLGSSSCMWPKAIMFYLICYCKDNGRISSCWFACGGSTALPLFFWENVHVEDRIFEDQPERCQSRIGKLIKRIFDPISLWEIFIEVLQSCNQGNVWGKWEKDSIWIAHWSKRYSILCAVPSQFDWKLALLLFFILIFVHDSK